MSSSAGLLGARLAGELTLSASDMASGTGAGTGAGAASAMVVSCCSGWGVCSGCWSAMLV